jgi:hypothetical protein
MPKSPSVLFLVWLVRKVNVVDSFVTTKRNTAAKWVRILGMDMWKSWGVASGAKFVH